MSVAIARPDARKVALAYLELTKPRIVMLVLLTGIPALLMAARGWPDGRIALGAILGTALAAASAAAFNHYFDRDIDGMMVRTRMRPLPTGTLAPGHALVFAFVLAALAWLVLAQLTNVLAAIVGQLSIAYYVLLYTIWLKRSTPQNIVIGGGAGATAPLISWAAVTGTIGLPAVLLAAIVFFWTPPHFWALALYRREDYARAGIPMLPVTHGEEETRRQIMLYTLCLVPVTLAPAFIGAAGPVYWIPALGLGGAFGWFAWRLMVTAETSRAVKLFRYSIAYLFLLFIALGVDAGLSGVRTPHTFVNVNAPTLAAGPALTIQLSSHTMGNLPVTAEPLARQVVVRRGEVTEVKYRFVNPSRRPVEFQAVHRITPASADTMFHKQVCFCSARQKLAPGASATLPVRFVVDPALPDSVHSLALDYALFELAPVAPSR
jgi:protoheme IX farnesyltransferase